MIEVQGAARGHARGRWTLATMAVACALLAIAILPAAAEARPLVTGLSGLDSYKPLALRQAGAAGIRLVRISVPWAGVAPGNEPRNWEPEDPADPHYDWGSIDSAVKATVETDLTPVLTIEGAPSWAQGCHLHGAGENRLCEPGPAALAAFATAVATRYSGNFAGLPQVRYWQGLNEPNLSIFFNPQFEGGKVVSAQLYRRLANAFYFAVKAVDPSNLVLAAGLGPIARPHLTVGPMRFARLLLCMRGRRHPHPTPGDCEGGVHFDIFDVHPYTTGGPKHKGGPDDVELGSLGRLQRLLGAADRAGRIEGRYRHTPLWVTEFSWASKPPQPGGLPMWIDTRWTAEALHQAWLAGVSNFFWFSLTGFPFEGRWSSEYIEAGLYFRGATLAENRPKEVLYAFRFPFVAYRDRRGISFWGRTPTSSGGEVAIQVREGRRWRNVSTMPAAPNGVFVGAVGTSYGRGDHGEVRAVYSGTSAIYGGRERSIPFSLHPVREFHQPPFGR